ncbi:alpha/beta family hydrolase [Kiloniella antarctica]|uniref:Alpha/beta family hydrolase n=1 Tax=Kiloniella antarctica TaxID=1550907 RepID=A0ABW5BDN8_9PROT
MTIIHFLHNGPEKGKATILFTHGAGAPMDTEFMKVIAEELGNLGYSIHRFEFPYMTERRLTGKKRPPDRAPLLREFWQKTIDHFTDRPLFIMGKSLGGRMATMVVNEADVSGVICLGYPFHPPGKPEKTRTEHLKDLKTPTLIIQGTRDPFGKPEEIKEYDLSSSIKIEWSEDGDHSLVPRKRSGLSSLNNWNVTAHSIDQFIQKVCS